MTNPDLLPDDELLAFKKGEPDLAIVYGDGTAKRNKEVPHCGLLGDGSTVPKQDDAIYLDHGPQGAD